MKEILVSLELAKLAKEKGFNLKVYGFYKGEELVLENQLTDVVLGIDDILYNYNKNNSVSAPTQSLLQKWLREVHGIIVTSKPYQDDVSNETDEDIEFQTLWENEILDVKDSYNVFSDNTFYHSYEEALEIGLQEALKLIKIK